MQLPWLIKIYCNRFKLWEMWSQLFVAGPCYDNDCCTNVFADKKIKDRKDQ